MSYRLNRIYQLTAALCAILLAPHFTDAACDPNCATTCNFRGDTKCDGICKAGYGMTTFSTCGPCDAHCNPADACQTAGKCDTNCIPGFTLNSVSKQCIQCAQHCFKCTINGQFKCDAQQCAPGYATDNSHICVSCDPNCDGPVTCATIGPSKCAGNCVSGYVKLSDSTCAPCGVHCTGGCTSEGPGYCDECSTVGCKSCADGFGLKTLIVDGVTTHSCYACGPYCDPANGCHSEGAGFCDPCSPAATCSSCLTNYGLVTLPDGIHHACRPCAKYCKSGCRREGGNCCDLACNYPTKWTFKADSTTCHICT